MQRAARQPQQQVLTSVRPQQRHLEEEDPRGEPRLRDHALDRSVGQGVSVPYACWARQGRAALPCWRRQMHALHVAESETRLAPWLALSQWHARTDG